MEPELEQRLYSCNKEQLLRLVQELAALYPAMLADIPIILDTLSNSQPLLDEVNESVTEDDWDFGGDDPVFMHPFPRTASPDSESEAGKLDAAYFTARFNEQDASQTIAETITDLLEEAELRTERDDYQGALELYALLIDERIRERTASVTPVLDEAIDAATPALEDLLVEASSNATFDSTTVTLSPLLTMAVRHQWLERLFHLWLKRLDVHRIEEDLPDILLNVAWSEDVALLRRLTQSELQKLPRTEYSNIVNFTRQYRARALEKFLKELPVT